MKISEMSWIFSSLDGDVELVISISIESVLAMYFITGSAFLQHSKYGGATQSANCNYVILFIYLFIHFFNNIAMIASYTTFMLLPSSIFHLQALFSQHAMVWNIKSTISILSLLLLCSKNRMKKKKEESSFASWRLSTFRDPILLKESSSSYHNANMSIFPSKSDCI